MIIRPRCPKCGGSMKVLDKTSKTGITKKLYRCRRGSCHYATSNVKKVVTQLTQGKLQ